MIIGVKYCGGCNPRYNRADILQQLQTRFARHSFCLAAACPQMDVLLVLQGCDAACADIQGYAPRYGVLTVTDASQLQQIGQKLQQIQQRLE